jgi:DNA mismatch repair ATPase MutS
MSATVTPAMRQYLDAKQQHRDAILLFRMGDFYEIFYEDALVAARTLEITLTSRSKDANGGGIPMCGVPFHAVDGYIARLVKRGFRVAICDQVEDPRKAKGVVKREVVRVVSPGTLTDSNYLDAREPAFIMAVYAAPGPKGVVGVALIDLSTGEFSAAEYAGADGLQALADELAVLKPREIIVPRETTAHRRWRSAGRRLWTSDHADRRLVVRIRGRAPDTARSAPRRRPRRVRPRRPSGRHRRGGRAGPSSARDAEGRPRPRALGGVPTADRCPAHRRDRR